MGGVSPAVSPVGLLVNPMASLFRESTVGRVGSRRLDRSVAVP